MTLTLTDGRYVLRSSFEERAIPKNAGFRWDPAAKCWYTTDVTVAARLVAHADASCKAELEAVSAQHRAALESSRAREADISIPVPEGLAYLPYQRAGIAYLDAHPRALLGDEMGLGKTIQVIGLLNLHPEIKRVLIVCPVTLRTNWAREISRWLVDERRLNVGIADSAHVPNLDIIAIGYEALVKHLRLAERKWDLVVVDECHRVKNPKAQRSKAVYALRGTRMVFLTGTPIVNRPVELQPIAGALAPAEFGDFWHFARRYCAAFKGRYGWDFSGASHLDELQDRLRSSIMIRRLKADVLTDLPAKRRSIVELPQNGAAGAVAAETAAFAAHESALADMRARVELAKASENEADYRTAVDALRDASRSAFAEIARLRHDVALAKVPAVIDHLEDVIESGAKVVVMAHHHDVVHAIAEHFGAAAVQLTGETPMNERDKAVRRFQSDDDVRIFIGSITAAGVGITLTAASHVVFAELDWVPGNITQAEDRCHRIGQRESVLIEHLVLDGSLDARMAKILVAKQDISDKALDAEHTDVALPEASAEPTAATRNTSREAIAKAAESMTAEQIALIHAKIRFLASRCDGAYQLDGQGFNRIDTAIGKSLAASPALTPRQAALAAKILGHYKRQLTGFGEGL